MNKRENIYSLKGFGKVFSFTLRQTFKNKGYIVSLVIFVLTMSLMGPIQYLSQRSGENAARASIDFDAAGAVTEKLYIYNETNIQIDKNDLSLLYLNKDGSDYEKGLTREKIYINEMDGQAIADEDELMGVLSSRDSAVIIRMGETGFEVNGIVSADSEIKAGEIDDISEIVLEAFDQKRLSSSSLSEEDIQIITTGVDTYGVTTEKDYIEAESKAVSGRDYMFYMLGYSIIIFLVVSMTNSYIITSVTEEKTSKLVESILVSVRPMALLMGKICGMLSYVVLLLVCGIAGSKLSGFAMRQIFHITEEEFSMSRFDFSIFTDFGVGGAVAIVLSIILAFLFFGIMGGLFGSACNKPEDIQEATGNLMMINMVCYMGSIFLAMLDKDIVNLVCSIVPPISFFMAPVTFVTGRIGIPVLILSFALQIAVVVLAMMLSARTYRNLVLSDASTPKLMAILKSAKN